MRPNPPSPGGFTPRACLNMAPACPVLNLVADRYRPAGHMPLALRCIKQKWVIRGSMLLHHSVLRCNAVEDVALPCDPMIVTERGDQRQEHTGVYSQNARQTRTKKKHITKYLWCWSVCVSPHLLSSLISTVPLLQIPCFFSPPFSYFNPVTPVIGPCDRKLQENQLVFASFRSLEDSSRLELQTPSIRSRSSCLTPRLLSAEPG